MTETVARSARLIAPTRAQGDADLVLFVFMVRTIGRKRATLCPESRTIHGRVLRHSSYAWKSARTSQALCVVTTQNARGIRAILARMKRTLIRLESDTEAGAFRAGIAQKHCAGRAMVKSVNGSVFMRRTLPQKPRPHCERQSQSLSRSWVKKRPIKTCIRPGMYPERRDQVVPPRHHFKLQGVVKKKKEWGMTLTPPLSRRETARRRAHCLLDEKPKAGRESEVEDV